ncbi:MAG: phosphoribosylanthranilate isomerase [Pseudomonadota bacterium]
MIAAKICGVRDPATLAVCRRARATHVGFNFAPGSPRALAPAQVGALSAQADGLIRVGLFVDAEDDEIGAVADHLDAIQLHGEETPARAAAVRARFGREVWKAFGIGSAADLGAAAQYAEAADLILYDAKPVPGGATGGTGLRIDWDLLSARRPHYRWGLAGGLTPANVARALAATGAPLVDVASGVEEARGVKSPALIDAFMKAVRSA